jgi:hypothetical protein
MIDETKAKEFALGIEDPSVPDGEKFKMATALDEYFQAEDLKVDKSIKKAFTSPSIEGVKIDDNVMAGYGTSPEEIATIKKGAANVAWLARREQKPIDHFNLTLPVYQDTYAQQFFKSPKKTVTDDEFYQLVSEDYKAQDNAHNLAFSAAARDFTADSAINEFNVGLTGSPVAGRMKDYHQSIGDLHLEYTQRLAPYRTIIDQAAKTIQSLDQTPSNTFNKLTDSLVFGKEFEVQENANDAFSKIAESLLSLPPKERLLVINAIGEAGSADPKEKKAYLEKIAISMEREIEKGVTGTASLAESMLTSQAISLYQNIPEMQGIVDVAKNRRELQVLAGQVKMMAHSKINPIAGNNWWEETGIGVARMTPLLAATFISSPASIAIMTGQFRDEATIEAVNAGVSFENAEVVGAISAPFMATQEFISNALPLGKIKIPFIDKWLKAATTSVKSAAIRVATRTVIGTATEISEEVMQTATPLLTQDLLSEWQSAWSIESGISKADWDERMPKISDIAEQTFGPALIVSFLMAGRISIADVKNSRALITSPDYMVKSGIAPDLANQITVEGLKGNYTEVDKLFRKGFDKGNKATPEQIKEAKRKINIRESAALEWHNKARQDFGLGTPANIGNGKYQFTTPILKDGKGNIIDQGVSAQFDSLSEANEAWMRYLKNSRITIRKAEQEFLTSMVNTLEEKQGLDVALMMDYDMFTKQFTELFPSTTAQVEERIKLTGQIDGAVEDVSLDNATLESEANDNKNYRILGTNSIEQREGISVGVITLYKGGSLLDLIEESAEVGVKRLMSDPTSRTKLILQIRDVEAKMKERAMQMGQRHMPLIATGDDNQVSNMEIIEAFSHIAKSYYVQTAKAVERPTFTSDMPLNLYLGSLQSSIAGMELKDAIDLVGEKTLNILYRAAQLKAIHDANGLNQDFVAALEKSVGLNVSNRNADAVVDTAAGIAADAGVTMSMGRVSPEQDAEYLAAAKAGDLAKAQRMVDEAAILAKHGPRIGKIVNDFAAVLREGDSLTTEGDPYGFEIVTDEVKNGELYISWIENKTAPKRTVADVLIGISDLFDLRLTPLGGSQESYYESLGFVKKGKDMVLARTSKSAGPITYDESGQVIPLSQRFNQASPDINFSMGSAQPFDEGQTSFSLGTYTKEAANDLADRLGISSTIGREYLNRVILPIMADLMAGGTGVGVPWEGGPIHPLLHYGTDVAWRSARGAIAGILGYLDKRGGVWKDTDGHEWALVAVFAMSQDAHQSNNNMFMSFMHAVENSNPTDAQKLALAKMMRATGQNALNEAIKKYNEETLPSWEEKKEKSKAKYLEKAEDRSALEAVRKEKADQAGKKYKPLRPLDKYEEPKKPEEPTENRLMNFPEQWTAQEMEDYVKTLIYPERADVMNRLKKQDGVALGLPDVETAIRQGRDDSYDMITGGSMLNVIKVDVTRLRTGLRDNTLNASDFGVPEHLSYDTVLPGEIVTHLRQPVPMNVAFPDMVREMKEASPKSSPTYLMQAKLPESVKLQKLTPKVFNAINDVQKLSIPRNRALMMISALNDQWEVAQKAKAKNIADYIRAVNNSVATSNLVSMTESEINAALKSKTLKIYRLPKFAIFFAIKKNADGTMEMFNAISNELALKGAMNVMMHKALSEGANITKITNVITDKKPSGVLASLFANHGWKIESESEISSAANENQEADWTSMGWDKARHPKPTELVMKYEGLNTNQISASPERLEGEDAGSMARGEISNARAKSGKPAGGNAQYESGGTDGAGASGNVGGYRGSIPRGGDSIVAELAAANAARLAALGLTAKERDAILAKIEANRLQEGQTFSISPVLEEERITPENKVAPSINGKPAADIFAEVKKNHGVTRSIYEAGYVLPDGTMLDFSGKSQVGDYQRGEDGVFRIKAGVRDWMKDQRGMDHREIEWQDMPDYKENWERMVGFLRLGAVRIDANSGMISMHSRAKITSAQASVLKSIVTSADGAYVDLEDDANNRSSMQLNGSKWGKVNGLLTQWANGETPEFEGTTFSMEKANRKNSLRVLLTKKALTDAALAQASWKDWYSEHKETLDEFFGDSAELFQKILSVTSQASSVKANVGLALKAFGQLMRGEEFDGKLRGEEKSGYLPAVISNLNAVKNNLVANGRKIANYTAANEGDLSRVVVDRHIARLLFGVDTPSKSQYDKAEKILTKIANEIGWSPSQVQAALWAYSIVKSGETPESYGAYLKKLESKPLTRKELKNGLTGNQLTKRIGNITRGGDGLASVGTGRGRYSSTSPTFSISRSDFTGRIEQSLRPLFEGSPDAKLKIGMMALKRAQAISGEALYNVGRPGAAKRKLAEMEASRIAKLGKVTDKTPDWVKKSLEKETTPEQAKAAMLKDKLNGWIQLHDAIVSSMPTEIRGTIGSISTLVKLSSDEARLKFIEERIPKMEKAVERYLKKEYGERIDKMLESAAVKGKAGEIPKSKFIVTVQDELNTIIDMASLSADDTVKEAARYEAEIISAQTAEDAADSFAKSQLLEVFGDLYGKQTTAEEMDVAHEYLKDLMTQGRNARKIIDEARAAEIAKMVEQAKADAFAGAANAATVQAGKDKGKGTTKGIMKGLLREGGSHRFMLSSIFGRSNKTADVFDERMILGVNAFETTQAARKKSLRDFMRALYGTKSKIKLDKELEKLETKVERSRVTYLSGEIRESDTKTVEEVAKIIKSPSTFGYSAEEAKLWEDEMDAWSNLPNARKRNLTIDRIKTLGTRIEIPLSQMEAVYMAMALRQPGILDQQSVHGYDHVTQTELEAFMSDDAKNWLAWFGAEYSAEYDTANEVFMKLFHTRMPQIQFYAPLLKNHQGNQASLDPLNSGVVSQSVNPGAVKSRRGRTSSLRIESALAVYQAHFVQMDYWVHMAEYLRDTQAVMLNADVQNAIKSGHGAEAMQTLSSWIQLEMSRGVGKGALVMHSSKLMRNLKSGVAMKALAFNIGTSIKTLSSVFYSLGEIPITRWPAAFTRGVEHWGKMWDTNIIQNRLELGGTPEIRHILANAGKSKNSILRLVENALVYGSVPTQYADAVLTSYSAAMVYGDRFAQAKDAGAGDDAAHKYAAREMEIAVSRTAQPNDWSGRSLIENDVSGVFNLLSMFSSDPRQKLGLVGEAVMKWKRGGATNEEAMRKVLAYWVIPGLMFQVANAVTRSLFKDDDKEWELDNFIRAAIVGPLQGLFLLGAAAEFFIASAVAAATEKLTGEKQDAPRNWRSSINPMVDMSDQFLQSIKKLPENMENEDYLGGAWQIMKAGGAMVTPFSPAGSAPGIADRVFKDTSTLFYGKED